MELLKKEIGGLPVWLWGAAAIGGFLLAMYLKSAFAPVVASSNATPASDAVPPSAGVPIAPPGTGNTGMVITVRPSQAGGTGPFANNDKTHPEGVPVRPGTAPSGQVATLPFGSQAPLTGNSVLGSLNYGSFAWYPVAGGYISGEDIVSVQTGAGVPGHYSPVPFGG